MIAHLSAISGVAFETLSSSKMLIRRTAVGDIRTLSVNGIYEKFYGSNVVAGKENSRRFLNSVFDECQGN